MASIQALQKALDNKQIDTSTLNNDQLNALDKAFKSGELKGYDSVRDLRMEQGSAAEALATEKEEQLRPFQKATQGITPTGEGIERADFELIGDVTGSIIPYVLDAGKIGDQMVRSGGAGTYGLQSTTQNMGRWGGLVGKVSRVVGKVGKRTAWGKAIAAGKLLPRTADTLKRVANFGRAAIQQLKYGLGTRGGRMHAAPTQLLQTEAKSQLLGMGGAGVGSALYGMAEAVTDIGGATQEDLASVSDNEIDKLPVVEREIVHASEAMKNAMIYNGLGFGLMPMLSATFRGVGHLLGLGGKQARVFAEESYKHGYESWGNFPHEVDTLRKLIKDSKAAGVVLISGDRHISEFSSTNIQGLSFPLVDFTSSGLTHSYTGFIGEENPNRIGNVVAELSFGILKFDFKSKKITMQMRGKGNKLQQEYIQSYN
ncbi:MAG: hypothetical protein HRT90_10995 [Candidatus Margulisbacteria bacterium]|nr:hypothetical protein [Candidatus Margulisiibacteriota bacterium]